MKTVDKALNLLRYFSPQTPMWGLSDLARAAAMDKATTLRMLNVLVRHEMLEQDRATRKFHLGTAPLNLAKVREATFPLTSVIQPIMERLAVETRETVHASVGARTSMSIIAIEEPQRATRVYVDPSEPLPFHATAPGIVFLAFSDGTVQNDALSAPEFQRFTSDTPVIASEIKEWVALAKKQGFAVSPETFEDEVIGIAAPFFDRTGQVRGAIAVATPTLRMNDGLKPDLIRDVIKGAFETTTGMGAEPPTDYLKAIG